MSSSGGGGVVYEELGIHKYSCNILVLSANPAQNNAQFIQEKAREGSVKVRLESRYNRFLCGPVPRFHPAHPPIHEPDPRDRLGSVSLNPND